ncbi:MAG: glycosyltransferase family 4 protein [Pirellulales bacterium]|nr:glycosyltransferase family 4 protein [Pirellulales bacterium]
MENHVFVCGYPGHLGGANTELWHTLRLWRRFGLEVTLIPTWQCDPAWARRLRQIGCRTVQSNADDLPNVPGLRGSVVVSMCNRKFLAAAARFRDLGCRIVWLGCMNWMFPEERLHYRRWGTFDRYVFQSRYQRDQLVPQLRKFGYGPAQGLLLRSPLAFEEFPFGPLPHRPGRAFVVGRISRAAADKFAPRTWQIYGKVPHPVAARVLGWSGEVRDRVGPPPPWAECLPPGSQTPQAFLPTLQAMVHAGAEAAENWPRVGLEAMAAGVPVVADSRGGWREMIRHGRTGYLCETEDQFAYYTARLAYDEPHRLAVARLARTVLETELANPRAIWAGWQSLLEGLGP